MRAAALYRMYRRIREALSRKTQSLDAEMQRWIPSEKQVRKQLREEHGLDPLEGENVDVDQSIKRKDYLKAFDKFGRVE